MTRTFRDGHAQTWWAADASLGWWGPDGAPAPGGGHRRPGYPAGQGDLVPGHQTCPGPAGHVKPTARTRPLSLAEIVRLYGIRHWIEQSYKQVKDELGWADFQVRSDVAIRRHQALVNCAFSFCWAAWFAEHPPQHDVAPQPGPGGGERGRRRRRTATGAVLAAGAARDTRLAFPLDRAAALVGVVHGAPAPAAASPDQLGRGRLRPAPLYPELTNYRYSRPPPGPKDKNVRLWEMSAGTPVRTFSGHNDMVSQVAFQPGGTLLAVAASDHTIRLWGTDTGTQVRVLTGHT